MMFKAVKAASAGRGTGARDPETTASQHSRQHGNYVYDVQWEATGERSAAVAAGAARSSRSVAVHLAASRIAAGGAVLRLTASGMAVAHSISARVASGLTVNAAGVHGANVRPALGGGASLTATAGLAHLIRTVASEQPLIQCSAVDGDTATRTRRRLGAQPAAVQTPHGVAERGGAVRLQVFRRTAPAAEATGQALRQAVQCSRALITGGMGSLGILMADWLAQRGCSSLQLQGRSGRGTLPLAAIGAGACVNISRVDVGVAEEASAGTLMAPAGARRQPLSDVLHAGGVLADALLGNQTPARCRTVLAPKVEQLRLLAAGAAGAEVPVRVMLFSSVAALLGSGGQGNYVAANGTLDAWAHTRHAAGAEVASVQWGAWAGGGMAHASDVESRMARLGIGVLTPEQGLAAVALLLGGSSGCRALLGRSPVLTVNPFAWGTLQRVIHELPHVFREFADPDIAAEQAAASASAAAGASSASANREVPEHLRGLSKEERVEVLQKQIMSAVQSVLGKELEPHQPLMDAGLDSLGMTEAR